MSRTVMMYVFAPAAIAFSLLCNAQSPAVVADKLYAEFDQTLANHDLNRLLSFFDPSCTSTDEKGKQMPFAEQRKQMTDTFNNAQIKNFNGLHRIKQVRLEGGHMIVDYESELHFQYQDQKAGWEPVIQMTSGEETWQKKGDQWKLVAIHVLRSNMGVDPQYAAQRQQELRKRLDAIQNMEISVFGRSHY